MKAEFINFLNCLILNINFGNNKNKSLIKQNFCQVSSGWLESFGFLFSYIIRLNKSIHIVNLINDFLHFIQSLVIFCFFLAGLDLFFRSLQYYFMHFSMNFYHQWHILYFAFHLLTKIPQSINLLFDYQFHILI